MDEIKTTVPATQTTIPKPQQTPPPNTTPLIIRQAAIFRILNTLFRIIVSFSILLMIYFLVVLSGFVTDWTGTDIFMLAILAIAIGLIYFLLSRTRVYYILSPDKLSYVSRHTTTTEKDYSLNQIRSVTMHKTFWGKLFGYGTLVVQFTPDNSQVYLANISQPHAIKEAIEAKGIMKSPTLGFDAVKK